MYAVRKPYSAAARRSHGCAATNSVRAGSMPSVSIAYRYAAGAGLKVRAPAVDNAMSQLIALALASRASESRSPLLTPATSLLRPNGTAACREKVGQYV